MLRMAAKLAALGSRQQASIELARRLGGVDILFFVRDPELPTFVAAPGFRSRMPSGKLWKDFLEKCAAKCEHTATLPYSDDASPTVAIGLAPTPEAVLVLIGAESIAGNEWIRELIPLYTAMFRAEQTAVVASASARIGADSVARTKAMSEVLARSRAELEEALAIAETARTAAVEASRVKSDFLATMSHELRTPLNAIGGYSQLLAMGIHGPVTDDQKETLDRIDRSQRHLLGLINDILNLSRLEAGKVDYKIKSIDVIEILGDLTAMIYPQLAAKQITHNFEIRAGICVAADREKLQQILLNILSNAIKFTDEGGTVNVSSTHDPDLGVVHIVITDTGRGIPSDKIEMIFEPFVQVDASHSRSEQGAGLGLSISRDLARGMGGEITVTSELGKGSEFIVTLPAGD